MKSLGAYQRNIAILSAGTIAAQAIPVAAAPVLTRLFSPEDFGIFALYVSIASIVSVIATGRYELAIMLPADEKDAVTLTGLSMMTAILVSLLVLVSVSVFGATVAISIGHSEIVYWLYLIPLSVFFAGAYQSLNTWYNRQQQYRKMAIAKTTQSFAASMIQIVTGLAGAAAGGLIGGRIAGQGASIWYYSRQLLSDGTFSVEVFGKERLMHLARTYASFPKYDILASLLNALSQYLPLILFGVFMKTVAVSGFYFLVQRVLGAPMAMVSEAVLSVYREEASREFNEMGGCPESYMKTLRLLVTLALLPFTLLLMFGEEIFIWVFGEEWKMAGEIARILAPVFFLRFIASPLSYVLYIVGSQKLNLMGQSVMLAAVVGSFAVGFYMNDIYVTLYALSGSLTSVYACYIGISYHKAKIGHGRTTRI